jgi:opacity protein-like surface antigen
MIQKRCFFFFSLFFLIALAAPAQFVSIGSGLHSPGDFSNVVASQDFDSEEARFDRGRIFSLDVGTRLIPFIRGGVHYSRSTANLRLTRDNAFDSRAEADFQASIVTFDLRVVTPSAASLRLFGFGGAGFSRHTLTANEVMKNSFPGGIGDTRTALVYTYGGGIERHLHQLIHLRFEVRNYRSSTLDFISNSDGGWDRLAFIAGITIGL